MGNALLEIGETEKGLSAIRESVKLMALSALPRYDFVSPGCREPAKNPLALK